MARPKKKTDVKQTWKVTSKPVADKEMFICYKLRDEAKPDEEGNRIYKGGLWTTKKEADLLANRYNEEGKY